MVNGTNAHSQQNILQTKEMCYRFINQWIYCSEGLCVYLIATSQMVVTVPQMQIHYICVCIDGIDLSNPFIGWVEEVPVDPTCCVPLRRSLCIFS